MMTELTSSGVVYVAPNSTLYQEACVSARSLKAYNPSLGVVIFTDEDADNSGDVFDRRLSLNDAIEACQYRVPKKLPPLLNSPFEKTLYLDGDTYVCGSIHEIFELLDQFDFLTTHAPIRDACQQPGLGPAFPEFNGGLLGFRKSEKTQQFLETWMLNYETLGQKRDQPSLRKTFYEQSDVRFYVLPPEFNLRINAPVFIGGHSGAKILHGRHNHFEKLSAKLSDRAYPRVALPTYFGIIRGEMMQIRGVVSILKEFAYKLMKFFNRKS